METRAGEASDGVGSYENPRPQQSQRRDDRPDIAGAIQLSEFGVACETAVMSALQRCHHCRIATRGDYHCKRFRFGTAPAMRIAGSVWKGIWGDDGKTMDLGRRLVGPI